jgi:hypothetical protein
MQLLGAEMAADCAADVTRISVEPLKNLSSTALLLYQALRETAVRTGAARGYVGSVTHVTVHLPLEVVALALGRHRVTIWRTLPKLRALGLVDARPHKCSSAGQTRNDGTLWCVRLNPDEGVPARLTYDDLKHDGWRDLDRDRRRGRTAFRAVREHREKRVQQSEDFPKGAFDLELLLSWSLPPGTEQNPVTPDCCTAPRRDLEAVLDVQYAPREARGAAVSLAAEALSAALRDRGGAGFYQLLLWQLLRRHDATGGAPWYAVYEQARRARVDAAEGFARKPGALFVSRLKGAPWWAEVWAAPPVRVGVRAVET